MKKKVKKIPKYNTGTTGVTADYLAKNNMPKLGVKFDPSSSGSTGSNSGGSTGSTGRALGSGGGAAAGEAGSSLSMPGGIATASNELLMNTLGIVDNSQAGVTLNSAAQGADVGGSIVPGWGHLIGGIAGGALGALKKGSVDPVTGEIHYGGFFGRSKNSLEQERNRVLNTNLASVKTQQLRSDYANQGIDPTPNVLAAEGGIVPGEHYASRREVEVSADGTNAVRYPWDPDGKDTYHVYTNPDGSSAMGNYVFTEEGVRRPNGEKYSDAAEKIIKGTKEGSKLRQISLRKLANEMEEQKMGKEIKKLKQGIPAHKDGKNPYVPSNMESNTWWTYVKNLADQFGESVEQFLNRAKLRGEDLAKFGSTGLIPYVNPTTGTVSFALPWGSKYIDGSTRADDTIINEKVAAPVVKDGQTVVVPQVNEKTTNVVDKNVAKVSPKKEITKKEIPVKKLDKSVGVLETPNLSKQYSHTNAYNPNLVQLGKDPFKKLEEKLFEPVSPIESELTTSNYSNPGWQDWLYRTALLTQPWWDMAKAESVNYTLPNANYIPVGADPTPLMKSADETYSIGNYNFAQFGGSTGQRMGYGAALANNRAKQYADAYKWQQDVQNKQIAQNVGIYNNWDTQRTEILNNVYDKTAANRATARNINRQNKAAALQNYGQMLRDDKQYAMNALKLDALTPLIMYGTENSDTLIKKARQILNK